MRFKKIALALFACMALGALVANAAQAAEWTTSNGKITGSLPAICHKHGTENLVLSGTVSGLSLTFTSTAIDCEKATIQNGTGMDADHSEGFLNFTNVTVSPAVCKVTGGNITTNHLTDRVIMDEKTGSTGVFDTFFTDNEEPFVEIPLEGAECPLAGTKVPVKGTACGESVHTNTKSELIANKTGELFKEQILVFGSAQQTTASSTTNVCALTIGKNGAATFAGTVANELESGLAFGAD